MASTAVLFAKKLFRSNFVRGTVAVLVCTPAFGYLYRFATIKVYDLPGDMKNHVVLITGASSGIGQATVEAFAKKGARVIMACRDIEKCRKVRREIVLDTKNRQVVCRECDLASFDSIKQFAARMIEEEPKINVIINNAAVKYVNPRKQTKDRMEMQLGVNHLGHHLLTMLLLDKLKESAPSRIVNVTCKAYLKGHVNFEDINFENKYSPEAAYDQSKLATILTTKEMAKHLNVSQVTVNAVDPGYTWTNLDQASIGYYSRPFRSFVDFSVRRTCPQGAYPVLYAAVSIELDGVSGKLVTRDLVAQNFDEKFNDPKMERKVWLFNQKWTEIDKAHKEVKGLIEGSVADKSKISESPI